MGSPVRAADEHVVEVRCRTTNVIDVVFRKCADRLPDGVLSEQEEPDEVSEDDGDRTYIDVGHAGLGPDQRPACDGS